MNNILPMVLMIASLSVISAIFIRKFSVLAALDVDSIKAEKEAKIKEQIIGKRLKRNITRWTARAWRWISPIIIRIGYLFKSIFSRLLEARESYNRNRQPERRNILGNIDALFKEYEEALKKPDYAQAEKKLLDIISNDPKNVKAFKELGILYLDKKELNEAIQTFEHCLKLCETISDPASDLANIYYYYALAAEGLGQFDEADHQITQALSVEPNHPKFLDMMLRISIIRKDKPKALDYLMKLKEVNPENQKLDDFLEKIQRL